MAWKWLENDLEMVEFDLDLTDFDAKIDRN
jgi:hypothetical protein